MNLQKYFYFLHPLNVTIDQGFVIRYDISNDTIKPVECSTSILELYNC